MNDTNILEEPGMKWPRSYQAPNTTSETNLHFKLLKCFVKNAISDVGESIVT